MPKIRLEPVRGMRDLLPPDSDEILWLEEVFINIAKKYGYELVILPVVESFSVFEVKSGPEIKRSMYVFKDKAGRTICLRPELTAMVARVYLRRLQVKPKPVKIFYVGKAYRYEEPQKGRYREFIQAGVEYIGEEGLYADIELLLLIRDYLNLIGLKDYKVKLGNMAVYRELFKEWGIKEEVQDEIIHYIDKRELDSAINLLRRYRSEGIEVITEISKCVSNSPEDLIECARNSGLNKSIIDTHIRKLAELLGIAKELNVNGVYADLGFARGLAYYTDIIFEVIPKKLDLSIGGGGRYNSLISIYGGPDTPATGFALGIDRIHMALKSQGWSMPKKHIKIALVPLVNNYYKLIDTVASKLRAQGAIVNILIKPKLSTALSIASAEGYDYIIIVGDREVKKGVVTVKNLRNRLQRSIPMEELSLGELP